MDLLFIGIFCFVAICVVTTGGRPNDTLNRRISRADSDFRHSSQSKHTNGRIVKRSSGPSTVYIASYIYDLTQTRPITVSLDSTMTKLIFKVEVNSGNPVIMATNAQGLPARPKLNGTVSTVEGPVAPADYGQKWTFTRLDRNIWDVTIMAESTIDFTYELIDVLTGATCNEYPIQGKQYKVEITVPNFAQLSRVALAMLFVKESSMAKDMSPLSNKGGGLYEFTYTMKNTSFMIAIDGMDSAMHPVRRLSPNPITPVNLKLIVPPYTGAMLYEGQQFTIDVTVISVASVEQDLDIRIVDDKNFAQAPIFLSPTIKPGENWTGQFILKGGPMGETTKVTITARPYLGHGQFGNGPSEIRQFTVYTNLTTTTTTTTTTPTSTTTVSTTSPSTATTSTTTTSTTTASTTASSTASTSTATTTTPTTTKLSTTKTPSSSAATASTSVASSQTSSALSTSKTSVSSSSPSQTSPQKSTSGSSISSSTVSPTAAAGGSGTVSAAVQSASGSTTKQPLASSTKAQTANNPQTLQSTSVTNPPPAGVSNIITQPPAQASSANAGTTQPPAVVAGAVATGTVTTSQSGQSGQGATGSSSKDNEFNKGDVLMAAIVSGVSGGTLVGIVGLVVMALLFRGAMKKAQPNKVKPQQEHDRVRKDSFRRKHVGDHNLAWT